MDDQRSALQRPNLHQWVAVYHQNGGEHARLDGAKQIVQTTYNCVSAPGITAALGLPAVAA